MRWLVIRGGREERYREIRGIGTKKFGKDTALFTTKHTDTDTKHEARRWIVNMAMLEDLPTPAFIVDKHVFEQNCIAARAAALKNGIPRLRPHVKTHKTTEGCITKRG